MTETEWLASEDPGRMLDHHQWVAGPWPNPLTSDRKLRLFACACVRQVWHLLTDDTACPYCGDADFSESDIGAPLMGGVEPYASRAKTYLRSKCACGGTGRINRSRRAVEVAEQYADGLATVAELNQAWNGAQRPVGMSELNLAAVWCARRDDHYDTATIVRECIMYLRSQVTDADQATLLRDIVGNPFRPVAYSEVKGEERRYYRSDGRAVSLREWNVLLAGGLIIRREWLTPDTLSLAHAAYEERPAWACERCGGLRFVLANPVAPGTERACPACRGIGRIDDGNPDPVRLAILADALEEAGCDDGAILQHLRGEEPCPASTDEGDWDSNWRNGWQPLRGPHVRGCWAVDLLLGKR